MRQITLLIVALAFITMAVNCKDEPPEQNGREPFTKGESVFVLNEGEFQAGNGTVSHYNKVDQEVENEVFSKLNNANLGDVVQSMTIYNSRGYIVVNNSQKIEVVGLDSLTRFNVINGFQSPRTLHHVQGNKAYVTELSGDSVAIVDLQSELITGYIPITGFTEEMVSNGNEIVIANNSDEKLYIVDGSEDSVINEVSLLAGNKSIAKDADGDIWVLCGGDANNGINGKLYELAGSDYSTLNEFDMGSAQYSPELHTNKVGDTLFYRFGDVYKMATNATSLPANAVVTAGSKNLYALGVDPGNSNIYVGDAGNFQDDGLVFRYTSSGQLTDSFKVGIAPGYFKFY